MKNKFFLFIAFALLLSCTEDEVYTDSELVAQKIQSVIDSENVTEVNIVRSNSNGGSSLIDASNEFEIDGIFIKMEGNSSYNLSRLLEYEVRRSNFTDTVLLILYLAS